MLGLQFLGPARSIKACIWASFRRYPRIRAGAGHTHPTSRYLGPNH